MNPDDPIFHAWFDATNAFLEGVGLPPLKIAAAQARGNESDMPNSAAFAEPAPAAAPIEYSVSAERVAQQAAKSEDGHTVRSSSTTCQWTQNEDGAWESACGHRWEFIEGGPTENGMKFCCYCGKPLVDVPYIEERDDEETGRDAYAEKRGYRNIDELLDDPRRGQADEINRGR